MKGLEFLGRLAKELILSLAGAWWFQGPRGMGANATSGFSEN